jgi:hypothetical protein
MGFKCFTLINLIVIQLSKSLYFEAIFIFIEGYFVGASRMGLYSSNILFFTNRVVILKRDRVAMFLVI